MIACLTVPIAGEILSIELQSRLKSNVLRTPTNEVPLCGQEIGISIAALADEAF